LVNKCVTKNLTKSAEVGLGTLEKNSFEYRQHILPCISWNQTNIKNIVVTFLC